MPGYCVAWGGEPGILSEITDGQLATAVARGSVPPDALFAEERAVVETAVELRRHDFALGRSCARRAMALLGHAKVPILSDAQRAPIWPDGVIGAISHCHELCCAVVGLRDRWYAIGVDAEVLQPLEPGLAANIISAAEQRELDAIGTATPWSCVVFSIKEAIYKAWFPVTRSWLGFHDAVVRLDPGRGRFEAELVGEAKTRAPAPFRRLSGRFRIDGTHVVATLAIAHVTNLT